jgi:transposase
MNTMMIESTKLANEVQPIGQLLTSFQRKLLQKSLQEELSDHYRQRLLIMILADEGKTQSEICKTLNCCPTTARHWILIAKIGMAHKWQEQPVGRPHTANEQYRERLKELVSQNPQHHGYGFQKWTGYWLSRHLAKELNIKLNARQVNRILKQMGLSTRAQSPSVKKASTKVISPNDNAPSTHILIEDLSPTIGSIP